ncbi:MAG: hypothetical protein U5N86_01510 [Planctomycetota bacterium]|nr:hypothetical protein [Planctomycetota bacterium]
MDVLPWGSLIAVALVAFMCFMCFAQKNRDPRLLWGYLATLTAIVMLCIVYVQQKNDILEQRYEIGKLRYEIENEKQASKQIYGDILALSSPSRCWKVLGPEMKQFVRDDEQRIDLTQEDSFDSEVAAK